MSNPIDLEDNPVHDLPPSANLSFVSRRFPYLLWPMWIVWLPLLIPPIMDLVRAQPGTLRLTVTLLSVALFVSIYVVGSWRNAYELTNSSRPFAPISRAKWLAIVDLIALSVELALLGRVNSSWLDTFIFTSAYVSGGLPSRKALPTVGVIVLLSLTVGWSIGLGWFEIVQANLILLVTWVTTISLVRTFVATRALDMAREEIGRLAVMNERLRIARDLHDLLGHNLSLIALKSELARRLITVSPERAATEIGDVENVARMTLQEVREAVGRYRQPTLSSELHGAQEILAAAGIAYQYEGTQGVIDGLPSMIEATLGWTIREGVTNVIRHSHAQHCTIRVTRGRQAIVVEVIDDGVSVSSQVQGCAQIGITKIGNTDTGHGLCGLQERVAALGGYCEAGAQANGGFRLIVSMSLVPTTHEHTSIDASTSRHIEPPSVYNSEAV